MTTTKA